MKCRSCSHANRENVRFCTNCGIPTGRLCTTCHCPAMAEDLFCGGCGKPLGPETAQPSRLPDFPKGPALPQAALEPKDRPSFDSERKNVSVLFADISGFTSLSERLDSEVITNIMNGCLKMMADVVLKYEGYIDKFIGDCIMAIFGAPVTHENDPELAVRAALDMLKAMPKYNESLTVALDKPLTLHIGINTGVVIAGGMGPDEKMAYTVMGDTVNLASRLESIAGDGQIFVSRYTYNLTRGLFDFVS